MKFLSKEQIEIYSKTYEMFSIIDIMNGSKEDLYYALTEGYIKPENFLEPDDAQKVRKAAKIIQTFFDEVKDLGYIKEN